MTTNRISLQNMPDRAGVESRAVRFPSGGATLSGLLHRPLGADGPLPAIVATGRR